MGYEQHPRSLISAFVIRLLESIISKPATSEISIFYLVSVAEETGLSLAFSETQKTGFVASRPVLSPTKDNFTWVPTKHFWGA